jgi:hypothetical protein
MKYAQAFVRAESRSRSLSRDSYTDPPPKQAASERPPPEPDPEMDAAVHSVSCGYSGEVWAGEPDPELAQPGDDRLYFETIPELPTTEVVQQKLEDKVGKIEMKDPAAAEDLRKVLLERSKGFLSKGSPMIRLVEAEHEIDTGDAKPFKEVFRRVPETQRGMLALEVQSMLEMGVIRPSRSPWGSRLLLVKKSDGSWRPCVDYRRLNELTVRNNYPLPVIDDILASVGSGKVFTRIDLYSAFWQVPVKETDIPKTAFTCPMGLYEFIFMPFGLKNAPATFQCVINHVLAPVLGKCCVAYLDDVIIYSDNEQEHAEHVRMVLDLLIQAGLRIKIDKCDFGVTEMELLGFRVSDEGISPISERCVAIRDLKVEKSVKGIQSFMGLVRYYQRFVPHLAELSQPLTKLLRKENSISEWGTEQDEAIVKIKSAFLEPPLLSHFDPSLPTILHTDASNYAVGAVSLSAP